GDAEGGEVERVAVDSRAEGAEATLGVGGQKVGEERAHGQEGIAGPGSAARSCFPAPRQPASPPGPAGLPPVPLDPPAPVVTGQLATIGAPRIGSVAAEPS